MVLSSWCFLVPAVLLLLPEAHGSPAGAPADTVVTPTQIPGAHVMTFQVTIAAGKVADIVQNKTGMFNKMRDGCDKYLGTIAPGKCRGKLKIRKVARMMLRYMPSGNTLILLLKAVGRLDGGGAWAANRCSIGYNGTEYWKSTPFQTRRLLFGEEEQVGVSAFLRALQNTTSIEFEVSASVIDDSELATATPMGTPEFTPDAVNTAMDIIAAETGVIHANSPVVVAVEAPDVSADVDMEVVLDDGWYPHTSVYNMQHQLSVGAHTELVNTMETESGTTDLVHSLSLDRCANRDCGGHGVCCTGGPGCTFGSCTCRAGWLGPNCLSPSFTTTTTAVPAPDTTTMRASTTLSPTTMRASTTLPSTTMRSSTTLPPTTMRSSTALPPSAMRASTNLPPSTMRASTTLPPSTMRSSTTPPPSTMRSSTTTDKEQPSENYVPGPDEEKVEVQVRIEGIDRATVQSTKEMEEAFLGAVKKALIDESSRALGRAFTPAWMELRFTEQKRRLGSISQKLLQGSVVAKRLLQAQDTTTRASTTLPPTTMRSSTTPPPTTMRSSTTPPPSTMRASTTTVLQGSPGEIAVTAQMVPPAGMLAGDLAATLEQAALSSAVLDSLQQLTGLGNLIATPDKLKVQAVVSVTSERREAQVAAVLEVLGALDAAKENAFSALVMGEANVTLNLPGVGILFASTLDSLPRRVDSGPVGIELPAELFAFKSPDGEPLIFSALSVDANLSSQLGSLSSVVLDLQTLKNTEVEVKGLAKPVAMTMPVAYNDSQIACKYWDEAALKWSTRGVRVKPGSMPEEENNLVCETFHFSLFGAILDGIVTTILCSNFNLLTKERLEMLFKGDWHQNLGARVLFATLALMLLAFIAAALLDWYRSCKYLWKDEYFLVRHRASPKPAADSEEADADAAPEGRLTAAKAGCLGCCALCCTCAPTLSAAFQEALDDIISGWFEFFAEAREVVQQVCGAIGGAISGQGETTFLGLMSLASAKLVHKFLLNHSRRGAAASLGMNADLVSFILEDEDLRDFLCEERQARKEKERAEQMAAAANGNAQASPTTPGPTTPEPTNAAVTPMNGQVRTPLSNQHSWREKEDQYVAWKMLRQEVCEALHGRVARKRTRLQHAKSVGEMYLFENPIGALYVVDIFQSCKQKAAVLCSDILGSFMFCAIFFEGSGMVRGRPTEKEAMCDAGEEGGMGFKIGRFIVIATASLFLASLPAAIMETLLTKGFTKVDGHRDSEVWQKQLLTWRIQERIFWVVVASYNTFCAFFLVVFMANLSEDDHEDWTLAGAIGIFEDFIAFPLVFAMALPVAARIWLCVHSRLHAISEEDMVRRICEQLHAETNMMMPFEEV